MVQAKGISQTLLTSLTKVPEAQGYAPLSQQRGVGPEELVEGDKDWTGDESRENGTLPFPSLDSLLCLF